MKIRFFYFMSLTKKRNFQKNGDPHRVSGIQGMMKKGTRFYNPTSDNSVTSYRLLLRDRFFIDNYLSTISQFPDSFFPKIWNINVAWNQR